MGVRGVDNRETPDRLHTEERARLEGLVAKHLTWIGNRVHHRLGEKLRRRDETCDLVQDALLRFIRYGPQVSLSNENHLRGLLARIAENVLRDKHDFYAAQRRDLARERPLPSDTILNLDPPRGGHETPSRAAMRHEREGWVRLGMEILDPDDRRVIVLRDWRGLTFPIIATEIGIEPDAARMRYRAALRRLTGIVRSLREGKLDGVLGEGGS